MACGCGVRSQSLGYDISLNGREWRGRSLIIRGRQRFGLRVLSQILVVQVTLYYILYDGYKNGNVSQIYIWSCSAISRSQASSLRH